MIGRIFNTNYRIDGNDLIYNIYGRTEEKEKFHLEVYGVEPYFCVEEVPSHLKDRPGVKRIEESGRTAKGKRLYKIVCDIPSDVGKLRDSVHPHYEADIQFSDRVRYDNGWKQYIKYPEDMGIYTEDEIEPVEYDGEIEPKICVADIEVWDKNGDKALDVENATEEVLSVALYDSFLDKYCVILNGDYDSEGYKEIIDKKLEEAEVNISYDAKVVTVPTEKHLFIKLKEWFIKSKMDIFTGWNFTKYDFPYLKHRWRKIGDGDNSWLLMPERFDLMRGNSKLVRHKTRNKLEIQAKRILGVGKLDTPRIYKMYESDNMDLLVAYNLLDTILTKEIERVNGILTHFPKLSSFCGKDIENLTRQSDVAESYIFHILNELADSVKEKIRLLSKEHVEGVDKKVSGGHVGTAKKGIFDKVAVADYKSEYPMIIMEFNISPDTYEPNPKPGIDYYVSPNGNYYKKEPMGIVPMIMGRLLKAREVVKKKMKKAKAEGRTVEYKRLDNEQNAIKVVMNSFYGLMASSGSVFRLSNKKSSDDITTFAREHIKFTSKAMENIDYDIEKERLIVNE